MTPEELKKLGWISPEEAKNLGIPVVLYCPICKVQHIDQLEEDGTDWSTKPHRKHLCAACKHVWEPYPVGTFGVAQ